MQKELSESRAQWLIERKPPNETELFKARGELRPSTTYYILLSANNSHGEGPISSPVEITTASGGMDTGIDWQWNLFRSPGCTKKYNGSCRYRKPGEYPLAASAQSKRPHLGNRDYQR
jgi:hypothetical protein